MIKWSYVLALWENDLSVKPESSSTTNILGWRGFAWAARGLNDAIKMLINRPGIFDGSLFFMRARFIELHAALTIHFIGRDFSRLARGTQVFTAVTWGSEAGAPNHGLLFLFLSADFGIFTTALDAAGEISSRAAQTEKRERMGEERAAGTPIIRLELKRSHEFIARAWRKQSLSMWARM